MREEMAFPETWEEYKKSYMIIDREEVYTNGAELIPCFRVEQWLNHLENTKNKQQIKSNKMEAVAALFGKKLKERFVINAHGTRYEARFLERGFEVYGAENPYVDIDSFVLSDLLAGYAEIEDDRK